MRRTVELGEVREVAFQPWQGGQPGPWQGGRPAPPPDGYGPAMRASHADRERAVDVLKAGFAEGRLPQQEYEQRITRAYQAQTYGELQLLVADLPQGPVPQALVAQRPVPQTFMPMPPPPTNGSATGALVCGILTSMTMGLTAIPAVILGHKARAEIRRTGERGDGFALAGIIIGWLAIGIGALLVLSVLLAGASSG
jgi:hypothetical protein